MSEFNTVLILRFRDLVTAEGDTISNHQEIISRHKFVWWGWWSKARERVPLEVFANFNKAAKKEKSGIPVYLFDSGSLQLYKAMCLEVEFSKELDRIKSPDKKHTPNYYNSQLYLAWFKFASISEALSDDAAQKELAGYSYTDVREFFDDSAEYFQAYTDKIVYHGEELRYQDRSVWFVRPRKDSDKEYRIVLRDGHAQIPSHFSSEFRTKPGTTILWFSDIHFGKGHGFPLTKTNKHGRPLWLAVEDAVKDLRLDVSQIVMSGDISYHSDSEGFKQASQFVENLGSHLRLLPADFLLCPGNHDFGFSTTPLKSGEELEETQKQYSQNYSDFYRQIFSLSPNQYFTSGRRVLFGGVYPVEIAALNSVSLQQTSEQFQGYGFVGNEQLEQVAKDFGWNDNTDNTETPTRIVMMHHHLTPVTYSDSTTAHSRYSHTLDAEAIIQWMNKHRVSVVLHGHMHKFFLSNVKRPANLVADNRIDTQIGWNEITICGLGSTGVRIEQLDDNRNTFGVLHFRNRSLEIKIYAIHPQHKTTEADCRLRATIPLYK